MSRSVLLDTGVLSQVTYPRATPNVGNWFTKLLEGGQWTVCMPEIADYELRRELMRAAKTQSIEKLDRLGGVLDYLPITTDTMRLAAEFWATARTEGRQTAPDYSLDADMILSAQAVIKAREGGATIATTNVAHLNRFADAAPWHEISTEWDS